MKESYVPGLFDRYALDAVVHVKDEEAFEAARRLAREEGIFVGMSSGAAMAAAASIAAGREQGTIVTIFPDGGDRYLSTNLFTTMLEPDFRFFDYLQRSKVDFKPVREGKVSIFVTGPPLDTALTLQESRRFLLADLLTRFLKTKGFSVNQVILVPDLDSRTIHGSCEAQKDLPTYTQQQIDHILADLDHLGVTRAQRYPRTSEHVDAIIGFSKTLLNKGAAYEKLRSVYFNISQSKNYGGLSKFDLKKIRLGSTVDLDAYEKLNPRDFTLLKRATLAELKRGIFIKSDWGNVLPTWHIATAAAAIQQLGSPIDIQVSGVDFLFPHLENVRAIAEALTGKPHANIWMLCEQMWSSKDASAADQLEETIAIRDLIANGYSGAELRYWLLSSHYCKPFHATLTSLANAVQGYRRLHEFINRLRHTRTQQEDHEELAELVFALEQSFFEALSDDLNTPKAFSALFKFIRQVNPILDAKAMSSGQSQQILEALKKLNCILGIFDFEWKSLKLEDEALIQRREQARRDKDWQEADRLRSELQQRGIRLWDTPQGARWERL